MILEHWKPQTITFEQMKEAKDAGYTPIVIINGEYYDIDFQEVKKNDDNKK